MNNFKIIYLSYLIIFLSINPIFNKPYYIPDEYITPPIKIFGAIAAGGSKMACAVIDIFGNIIEQKIIPTTTPKETVTKILDFFSPFELSSLGIGTFGPVDINPKSPTYGSILNSVKVGWQGFNYLEAFKSLNIPIGIDTNVNASCLGETAYGASRGFKNVIYVTIGTGIGIGIISERRLLHGMMHPEGGHIFLEKQKDDKGESVCPYHDSCFEGLASGPSIKKRYGKSGSELIHDEKVWDLEAEYISQALVNYIMILQPEIIVLGGGVINHHQNLFPLIRKKVSQKINDYVKTKELENLDEFIVPSYLGDQLGILGSFKIGLDKFYEEEKKAKRLKL